ncbi:MAG TPA: hypothetical protein VJ927_04955 [Actinomycetota bacterium]|nr:hypothetical protein [Actinomycetota bacterium]
MDEGRASEGSRDTEQPGVRPEDAADELTDISEDDIEITAPDELPPGAPDDSPSIVNADLVDDADEFARAIQEATGESVEVVSEKEQEEQAD